MDDFDFELVDNEKRHLARHSLARLKALAPTFPERSRERLACVELIAEREQALAQAALKIAARRSMWALFLSVVALVVPVVLFVAWSMVQQREAEAARLERPRPPVPKPAATLTPTPEPTPEPVITPEPLPPALGELPMPTTMPE
ncbi:MAG: hypothetical protein ACO3GO_01800 [Terrimicrobiaceae bacterium]